MASLDRARIRSLLTVTLLLASCGGPAPDTDASAPDAQIDASTRCTGAADCDDGLFCNGTESCTDGRCVRGAVTACDDGIGCTIDGCSEALRQCVAQVPDEDHDGAGTDTCLDAAGAPLGTDCDDGDDDRFPGNTERCDVAAHDEDCDETTHGGRDADADGHEDRACCNGAACGDDCDDAHAEAQPDATEVCNLIDDDCNGAIDEGTSSSGWVDADRDGRGDPTMPTTACGTARGFSVYDDDCDDTTVARNGAQQEICDGIDNDCDLTIDEDASAVTWYGDTDGDGFGNAASGTTSACVPPVGFSLLGTDCDDAVAFVSPAAAELCNGLDDDCSGAADYVIAAGDLEDDDLDGVPDTMCASMRGADCDDRDGASGPGEAESCDGRDNDCDTRIDEGVTSVAHYRDADGDGYGDAAGAVMVGCSPMLGYVRRGGDCDDASLARHPGATEGCNAIDDDCDTAVDEADASLGCSIAHGAGACVAGTCALAVCDVGWGDCSPGTDGCETNVSVSSLHCGRCGRGCAPSETCIDGACDAPFDTTGLVAWMDASDPGIVTTGVNSVASWPNRAGGAPFEPFDTVPTLVTSSGFAGPSIRFTAGGMRSQSAIWATDQHTIIALAYRDATGGEDDLVGTDLYVGPAGEVLLMFIGVGARAHFWTIGGLSSFDSPTSVPVRTPVIVSQVADATTLSSFLDGALQGTRPIAEPRSGTLQPVYLGSRCASCYPSGAFIGEMAEVLVFSRALAPAERAAVESYLRARWGL
jgi:hypothetical protein